MMATAAVGIYPYALPARDLNLGLTISEAATSSTGMKTAFVWWPAGMALACAYMFFFLYRKLLHLNTASAAIDH